MGISDNHFDPAFRYESLARQAFNNCRKAGDPYAYAMQEVYNNFVPEPNLRGKRALSTVLNKYIADYFNDGANEEKIAQLIELEERIWAENLSQIEIIEIIDNAIVIVNN